MRLERRTKRKTFDCEVSTSVGSVSGFQTEQSSVGEWKKVEKLLNPILRAFWLKARRNWTSDSIVAFYTSSSSFKSYFLRLKFYGLCQLNSMAFEFNTIFRKELTENCSKASSWSSTVKCFWHTRSIDSISRSKTNSYSKRFLPSILNNFLSPSIRTRENKLMFENFYVLFFYFLLFLSVP